MSTEHNNNNTIINNNPHHYIQRQIAMCLSRSAVVMTSNVAEGLGGMVGDPLSFVCRRGVDKETREYRFCLPTPPPPISFFFPCLSLCHTTHTHAKLDTTHKLTQTHKYIYTFEHKHTPYRVHKDAKVNSRNKK